MQTAQSRQLIKQLGVKVGFPLAILQPPPGYLVHFSHLPQNLLLVDQIQEGVAFVQLFADNLTQIQSNLSLLNRCLDASGCLWLCWTLSSSSARKIPIEKVQHIAAQNGLVFQQILTYSSSWQGLQFIKPS